MHAAARQIFASGHVFFSFTMDLTRPIQAQMDLAASTLAVSDWLADEVRCARCPNEP